MKCRRLLIMTISFMLAMSTCTTAYAQSGEFDKMYTSNDVVYESSAPKPLENSSAKAIWMTYEKSIVLEKYTESQDPNMSEFPQSVYYVEPNPAGYGEDAVGTLYLAAVGKMYPNNPNHHGYFCSYRGTMGYFLL